MVDCEDLYTVASDDVLQRVGDLDQQTQSAVDDALRIVLDLRA